MATKPKIRILNKLGRTKIHENLAPKGSKAITRTLSDEEYKIAKQVRGVFDKRFYIVEIHDKVIKK